MQVRLEEKQRAARRQRELEAELAQQEGREFIPYSPVWYKQVEPHPSQVGRPKLHKRGLNYDN